MQPNVEGTRRRAALRGEEAVAKWRLRTGTWSARVYAVVAAAPALMALMWKGEATLFVVIYSLIYGAIALALSFRVARASRPAAIALLVLFALDRGFAILIYGSRGAYQGLLVAVVIAFGLIQGVWGATSLGRIERERATQQA